MKFLLTNDDGIDAPGLQALTAFAKELGEVIVVAPDGPRSGFSHCATMYESMELRQIDGNAMLVPVRCGLCMAGTHPP